MNDIRNRVRSNVPAVVLTLLGIIQALALEQLWTHVLHSDVLYALNWQTLTTWTQIFTTLIAIILVWLVYAVNVTRFRWLPTVYEFILPFWVGFIQLLVIQALATSNWILVYSHGYTFWHHDLDCANHTPESATRWG